MFGSIKEQINDYLIKLSENKFRLKEFSAFNDYVNDSGYYSTRVDLWWDINNNIMFWKQNNDFETKFKILIGNIRMCRSSFNWR